jgi:predicted nucleic acid-binding protein
MDRVRQYLDVGALVLVDTSAYFALVVDEGARHQTAIAVLQYLRQRRARLFTTSIILAETHALLLSRLNRVDLAAALFEGIYTSRSTTIIRPTEADELAALALIKRYADKRFSFADALSFVTMEQSALAYAFTFDRNFAQYGFVTFPLLDP